ncbi:macrophage colony-stimulating factor 1 receptor isoform X2 [Trichomycterus rosablanca]|uniref:macrophage colony-stimulating factor 1 receptor isoform X2 n=1 Tax=Trichomycterus rosablanca TaxID=2290929 RepID=UPI002F35A8A6
MSEMVGVVGETLMISCYAVTTDHSAVVSWTHSAGKELQTRTSVTQNHDGVHMTSVLIIPNVSQSDAGNLTCIGKSSAGVNTSTVSLRIMERPYILLTPLMASGGSDAVVDLMEGRTLELKVGIDAHPAVQETWWDTPRPQNMSTNQQTINKIHRSYRSEASFLLRRIRGSEGGRYVFNARSANVTNSTTFRVHVFQKPSVVLRWKNGTLSCIASGYPTPTISWYQCEQSHSETPGCNENTSSSALSSNQLVVLQKKEFQPDRVESVLIREIQPNTSISCVAVNSAGEERASYQSPGPYSSVAADEHWISRMFTTIVSAASVLSALLFILLGVCIYRCKQKPKYEIRWKIIEMNDGNNYTYVDPTQLPYNTQWEFPRDRLAFGQVLGAGAFGKVVEAAAYGLEKDDRVTRVAVKMLKPSAHLEEKEALMCELKILSHLGSHANIVNLLGACTRGGPVLLITEYCSHGDLLNFLRRKASILFNPERSSSFYRNLSDHQHREHRNSTNGYMDMRASRTSDDGTHGSSDEGLKDLMLLDMNDLLSFSSQVAQGMDFLSSKNCIHRDVAARNVLVTEGLVAKICDFGLARDIMNDENYVVRGNARLPVKWMSPESIFNCIYTVQSDVWSYGILLWEIFSLGRSPYPDVKVDARFYEMIKDGYQMSHPDFAPPEMYQIMMMCWNLDPNSRPTFGKIVQTINTLLPETSEQQQYKNLHQELKENFSSVKFVFNKSNQDPRDQTPEDQRPLTQSNNYQIY